MDEKSDAAANGNDPEVHTPSRPEILVPEDDGTSTGEIKQVTTEESFKGADDVAVENESEVKDKSPVLAGSSPKNDNVDVDADLNSNVSISRNEMNLDSIPKIEDKLEMAVKQSEIIYLNDEPDPVSASLQYKSATEVYEKTGDEEALLLNESDDDAVIIVTSAEENSANNIIDYETNASENVEVHSSAANDELSNKIKVTSETSSAVEADIQTTVCEQVDAVEQNAIELINAEEVQVLDTEPMDVAETLSVSEDNEQVTEVSLPMDGVKAISVKIQQTKEALGLQITGIMPQVVYEGNENDEVDEYIEKEEVDEDKENEEVTDVVMETALLENEIEHTATKQLLTNDKINDSLLVTVVENTDEATSISKYIDVDGAERNVEGDIANVNYVMQQCDNTHYETVEQQLSAIVKQDDVEMPAEPAPTGKTMSIVEAITRDFDEIDSDDADSASLKMEPSHSVQKDIEKVNVVDEVEMSQSTFIVQSTEEVIVLESEPLDRPDTVSENSQNASQESAPTPVKASRTTRVSQIPSHVLGRNIDNPADDPFRNGKVPPKPRLGVKIPYRNLTSQIVSKDEIAQEILERQRSKYGDFSQPQGDVLFAKKLTQRLARKIAPPITVQQEVRPIEIVSGEKYNNSDLIAILEGDGDDIDSKKLGAVVDVSKTEINMQVSKMLERQIALKQLNELPKGRNRLRRTTNLEHPVVNKVTEKVQQPADVNIAIDNVSVVSAGDLKCVQRDSAEATNKNSAVESIESGTVKNLKPQTENVNEIASNSTTVVNSKIRKDIKEQSKPSTDLRTKAVDVKAKTSEAKVASTETKGEKPKDKNEVVDLNSKKAKSTNIKEKFELKIPSNEVTIKKQETKTVNTISIKNSNNDNKPKKPAENSKVLDTVSKEVKRPEKIKNPEVIVLKLETGKSKEVCAGTALKSFVPVEHKFQSNVPIKTYTRKRKSTDDIIAVVVVPEKRSATMQKESIPTYVTKSSRVIKRKVIWDPDEPSTVRSMALKSPKPMESSVKIEKPIANKSVGLIKMEKKIGSKKSIIKSPDKSKKRLSEVDRLLMDEGAVNMLYAFKNTDESPKKKKATVISLDRAQRELLNKTNEIKRDLTNSSDKESPKSLRKKDSLINLLHKKTSVPAVVTRKKSKDSTQSSTNSRPTSPGLIYLHHAEASRIIRRHSSSSYSSLEDEEDIGDEAPEQAKSDILISTEPEKVTKRKNTSAEIPKGKKIKQTIEKDEVSVSMEKIKVGHEMAKNFNKLIGADAKGDEKYSKYKTFSVKKIDHLVQIILLPSVNNQVYLTPEILQEMICILKELQQDNECHVVLVSSSAASFCQGINYKTLVCDKEQTRRLIAKKLATCVSMFLKTLSTFSKIIIAGVHGDTVGLGVTMLPLFDMVIASDTAMFSIPNARLGCAVEGGSLLSLPHLMHNVLVSELLYASRKLIAAEAMRLGMVTRVLWPDKFQHELMVVVKIISNQSQQFMQTTKKQLRHHMVASVDTALTREVDTLIQHWTSTECQENFAVYATSV